MPRPTRSSPATRHLATQLRAARKARGLTLEALAHEVGASYSHVSDLERALSNPTFRTLIRLADVLQINPAVLVDGLTAGDLVDDDVKQVPDDGDDAPPQP